MTFVGSCVICNQIIAFEYDPASGLIDFKATEDGRAVTWVRHYATPPPGANPDCAVYFSEVTEVANATA